MRLEKELVIDEVKSTRSGNVPYVLTAVHENNESKLVFDDKSLRKHRIKPSLDLIGKILVVRLNSVRLRSKKQQRNLKQDDLLIDKIEGLEERRLYHNTIPLEFYDKISYNVYLVSSYTGSGHLNALPCPLYKLNLGLSETEYNRFKRLTRPYIMKARFSVRKSKSK